MKLRKESEKKEKEEAKRESMDKLEVETEKVEAQGNLVEDAKEEAKQTKYKGTDSISEANKKEQEMSDEKGKEEIGKEETENGAETTKLICENNRMENFQDQSLEKISTEASNSMKARDIVFTTNGETLNNGKSKEDDVDTRALSLNGKEETSESSSKDNDIAQSGDAAEDAATPIKRRGTTLRRNDSKSLTSMVATSKQPYWVDGESKETANTKPTSHTFHISRVQEKSYSRPTRTRSQSASRGRRSKSITANDLVSVLANITIRYQEVSIGGHCKGRVEVIKAMKEEVSRNRQRLYKH